MDAKGCQVIGFNVCPVHPIAAGTEFDNGAIRERPDLRAEVGGRPRTRLFQRMTIDTCKDTLLRLIRNPVAPLREPDSIGAWNSALENTVT